MGIREPEMFNKDIPEHLEWLKKQKEIKKRKEVVDIYNPTPEQIELCKQHREENRSNIVSAVSLTSSIGFFVLAMFLKLKKFMETVDIDWNQVFAMPEIRFILPVFPVDDVLLVCSILSILPWMGIAIYRKLKRPNEKNEVKKC